MDKNLAQLNDVARMAVEHVGSANYQDREDHAIYQLDKAFANYARGQYDMITFSDENPACGCRACRSNYGS